VEKIPLYFYVPMFPWKEFFDGMDQKIQKHKEEMARSGKFKKPRRKEWRKEKEEIFYVGGGSHTRVFSIGWEHLRATLPQENPLVWGPPLQQKTHPPPHPQCKDSHNHPKCRVLLVAETRPSGRVGGGVPIPDS